MVSMDISEPVTTLGKSQQMRVILQQPTLGQNKVVLELMSMGLWRSPVRHWPGQAPWCSQSGWAWARARSKSRGTNSKIICVFKYNNRNLSNSNSLNGFKKDQGGWGRIIITVIDSADQPVYKPIKHQMDPFASISRGVYNQMYRNKLNAINPMSSLFKLTRHYLNTFDTLYNDLENMRQIGLDQGEKEEVDQMGKKIEELAKMTVSSGQGINSQVYRGNIDSEIEELKKRMSEMQRKHENLRRQYRHLEQRVEKMETAQIKTQQELERLSKECREKFNFFEDSIQALRDENGKLYIYVDEKFQASLKPSEKFQNKLMEYSETNYRVFEYAKRMYWGLMNQVLAYRALSTGLVQKGYVQSKFKQFGNILGEATNIIGGVPVIGGFLYTVRDISSIFFDKQDEVIIHNMSKRVEGYFVEEAISEDVAEAVMILAENEAIRKRLFEFKKREDPEGLEKFLKRIENIINIANGIISLFVKKVAGIEKDLKDNNLVTENVITDTSLLVWKLVEEAPADPQHPISEAARKYVSAIREKASDQAEGEANIVPQCAQREKYFKVKVVRAELTKKKEMFGKMDPYCVIKYGPNRHQTERAKDHDMSPIWNHEIILESSPTTRAIIFEVFDHEKIKKDDFLGEGSIIDSQYSPEQQVVELLEDGTSVGRLYVTLHP